MKNVLKIGEMVEHCPAWLKDAFSHVAKDAGLKTDDMELHRHSHSEKSKVNGLDSKSRQSLKYVSARTQDRDDEIVIPQTIDLKEFRKYSHVLVNHNYSLLPVGSDEWIEADDYGIKALTTHADTGEGTLANVIWHLVEQGHMKASSIGFVPTSFTKPGARDWDHVANQLQSNWKEFDKARAEKSVSRIITGGVLLEHSFVSVPCNTDAEMVQVFKGMRDQVDATVCKQLGWEKLDKIVVPVPAVEKEKFELTTKENPNIPGHSFTECVLIMEGKGYDNEAAKKICGKLQAESGEKGLISDEAINKSAFKCHVSDKGLGILSVDELREALSKLVNPVLPKDGLCPTAWVTDIWDNQFVYNKDGESWRLGYKNEGNKVELVGIPEKVEMRRTFVTVGKSASDGMTNDNGEDGGYTQDEEQLCVCDECEHECDAMPGDKCPKCKKGEMNQMKAEKFVKVVNKGDVEGHEFHGNQYSGGGGSGSGDKAGEGKLDEHGRLAMFATRNDTDKWVVMADGLHQKFDTKEEAERVYDKLLGKSGNIEDSPHGSIDILSPSHEPKYRGDYKPEKVTNVSDAHEVDLLRYSKVSGERQIERARAQAQVQRPASERYQMAKETAEYFGGSARDYYAGEKSVIPSEIKVVHPVADIKVLFTPPDPEKVAKSISEAVERALSRRTGKLL